MLFYTTVHVRAPEVRGDCHLPRRRTHRCLQIFSGIRQHFRFPKLVKGFSGLSSDKSDNMIIHSIALLDQMDKDINTLVKPHIDSLRKTTVSKELPEMHFELKHCTMLMGLER